MAKDPSKTLPSLVVRQMRLSAVRGPLKGKRYRFSSHRVQVGKAENNDIVIPDDTVSRHHFEVIRDTRGFLVRDLESTNGTLLDGAQIREAYIRPGSIVAAGGARLKFSIGEDRRGPEVFEGTSFGPLVFKSLAMRRLVGAAKEIALSSLPLLVLGEPGTGKKTYCRAIHMASSKRNAPLVFLKASKRMDLVTPVSRSEDLNIARLLREAIGGSLVIEEPWELSGENQATLTMSLKRMDSKNGEPAVRLFATTSRRLSVEVENRRMDGPLASYLGSMRVHMPALRERPGDIEILLENFWDPENKNHHGGFPPFLIDLFYRYLWPGNIRALRLMVDTLASSRGVLPNTLELPTVPFEEGVSFRQQKRSWVDSFERAYLQWLIDGCKGNVSKAAREASMDRKHLNKLLKRHGIKS